MTEYRDEPFAMRGVYSWIQKVGDLGEIMKKEGIPWGTFDDGGEKQISATWNYPATPTYYLIDERGVIQNKWIGINPEEDSLESMLEFLIRKQDR